MGWKEDSFKMFFEEGRPINEIAAATGISRQSISAYLGGQPEYKRERQRRKDSNAKKRREYKREKNREYRSAHMEVTAETMKREHDIAAAVLSREKYYG